MAKNIEDYIDQTILERANIDSNRMLLFFTKRYHCRAYLGHIPEKNYTIVIVEARRVNKNKNSREETREDWYFGTVDGDLLARINQGEIREVNSTLTSQVIVNSKKLKSPTQLQKKVSASLKSG